MITGKTIFNTVFVVAGGTIGSLLGAMDEFLYVLIVFVAIDYITGLMCAILDKKLCSKIGKKGIFGKIFIFLIITIGHMIDAHLLDGGGTFRTMIIFFYIANEGISILENAATIGLPVPEKLKDLLAQFNRGNCGEACKNKFHKPKEHNTNKKD